MKLKKYFTTIACATILISAINMEGRSRKSFRDEERTKNEIQKQLKVTLNSLQIEEKKLKERRIKEKLIRTLDNQINKIKREKNKRYNREKTFAKSSETLYNIITTITNSLEKLKEAIKKAIKKEYRGHYKKSSYTKLFKQAKEINDNAKTAFQNFICDIFFEQKLSEFEEKKIKTDKEFLRTLNDTIKEIETFADRW